jgi:Rieske Fe-S protein
MEDQPRWRRDFPIDWPQDHYVARRDFVKFLTLTSLAFAVGQFWIVLQNLWRRARGLPPAVKIRPLDSIPPGSSVAFDYPTRDDAAVLVRGKDGSLVAYGQECTHLSCAVIPKPERGMLHCPCHEGWFDLGTGRPVAGPPRRPLDRIVLEVRNGHVWAVAIERRTV